MVERTIPESARYGMGTVVSMQRLHDRSVIYTRLKPIAAVSIGLYLFLNAFLVHCLIRPHNTHIQQQTNAPLASVCLWIYKTVSPHAPSTGVVLPVVSAFLLIPLPLLSRLSQFRIIRRTGRSPPQHSFA